MKMSFEDKEAELRLPLTEMQDEPTDLHKLYQQIRLKLNEMKAYGMPLPADLVQFEQDLEAEFAAEKADAEREARMRTEDGAGTWGGATSNLKESGQNPSWRVARAG